MERERIGTSLPMDVQNEPQTSVSVSASVHSNAAASGHSWLWSIQRVAGPN